jgi:hypothetical protein
MTLTPGTFLTTIGGRQRRDTKKEPRECEGPYSASERFRAILRVSLNQANECLPNAQYKSVRGFYLGGEQVCSGRPVGHSLAIPLRLCGAAMSERPEFVPVFNALREILRDYAPRLNVVHDKPDNYYLDTHTIGANKRPIFFGGVRIGKSYVSYYLMPIYGPQIRDGMSPALKKRMQGKACFNFTEVDGALFKELDQLTKRAYQFWRELGWVS